MMNVHKLLNVRKNAISIEQPIRLVQSDFAMDPFIPDYTII